MTWKDISKHLRLCAAASLAVSCLTAAEHHGLVKFAGLPLPGATITASQGDKKLVVVSDEKGAYSFPDLADGLWTIQVEMLCFTPAKREVAIAADAPSPEWEMKMLPFDEIKASAPAPPPMPKPATATTASAATSNSQASAQQAATPAKPDNKKKNSKNPPPTVANPTGGFQRTDLNASANGSNGSTGSAENAKPAEDSSLASASGDQRASDGLLINGSQNNGQASPFAQSPAFGNARRGGRPLYNGNVGLLFDNSALDASPYSLTGQHTPKQDYNFTQGMFSFGGPVKIPHIWRPRNINTAPNFTVNYQWTRNRNAVAQSGLMPTAAERSGDLSQTLNASGQPVQFVDPKSGAPFPGNIIPQNRISPQAAYLLSLFPDPNFTGGGRYNYQVPLLTPTDQDSVQSRVNKSINNKNQVFGNFNYARMTNENPNLFGFRDGTHQTGVDVNINWTHRLSMRRFFSLHYSFSRQSTLITPFFSNQKNISGLAGINGNNQDPENWGPPALSFASGISGLYDGQESLTRNQTHSFSGDSFWNHGSHNVTFGADFRRQQFNLLSQQDARGSFGFTGASTQAMVNGVPDPKTGSDLAGFLLGIPDTSGIAFGNADKYFRANMMDGYITDDWRVGPGFTLNAGMRWEYGSPITEKFGRLVNLDIAPGYSAVSPVVANNPKGSLTGQQYPASLIQPDRHGFEPRVAFSWHPILASSLVVRGGYGVYYDTSVFLGIATAMAQQSPLSKSLSVQNSPGAPLTLANGFNAIPTVSNTYAVDPHFLTGYSQTWQLSAQQDLRGGMILNLTYIGIKGTRGRQQFLPNTYPTGVTGPCPSCPAGYTYLTSNGNSTREAAQIQLRRRLHNGFTASIQYVFSKSIDDAALGAKGAGGLVAQNWLNLAAERALSNFDQRHVLTVQAQYSTGVGLGGGALLSGWKGTLFKEWTFVTNLSTGSGTPLTPIYGAASVKGVNGTIRPDYIGGSLYDGAPGFYLNRAAYAAPAAGEWGDAGRNSIIGPYKFSLNGSLGRSFRLSDRKNVDFRFDSTNLLNHVTFPSWNTVITSAQFGLPTVPNAMRSMRANVRLRF